MNTTIESEWMNQRTSVCERVTDAPQRELRNIVVPIDLIRPAVQALRFAGWLAKHFGSRVYPLHVEERGMFEGIAAEDIQELTQIARRELPPTVPSEAILRCGRAAPEIINAATELRADLIVLATWHHSRVARALLGSTADAIAHRAPCPVLLVRCDGVPQPKA